MKLGKKQDYPAGILAFYSTNYAREMKNVECEM